MRLWCHSNRRASIGSSREGLPRGVITEDHTDGDGDRDGCQDGDERGFGRPASQQTDEDRGSPADGDTDCSPEQAEHDGLDEETAGGCRGTEPPPPMRRPISR